MQGVGFGPGVGHPHGCDQVDGRTRRIDDDRGTRKPLDLRLTTRRCGRPDPPGRQCRGHSVDLHDLATQAQSTRRSPSAVSVQEVPSNRPVWTRPCASKSGLRGGVACVCCIHGDRGMESGPSIRTGDTPRRGSAVGKPSCASWTTCATASARRKVPPWSSAGSRGSQDGTAALPADSSALSSG